MARYSQYSTTKVFHTLIEDKIENIINRKYREYKNKLYNEAYEKYNLTVLKGTVVKLVINKDCLYSNASIVTSAATKKQRDAIDKQLASVQNKVQEYQFKLREIVEEFKLEHVSNKNIDLTDLFNKLESL